MRLILLILGVSICVVLWLLDFQPLAMGFTAGWVLATLTYLASERYR